MKLVQLILEIHFIILIWVTVKTHGLEAWKNIALFELSKLS